MNELIDRARSWIAGDPDPVTRSELESVIESGDRAELEARIDTVLEFGTAGIRGEVGAGPGRMNRAVVIRTTRGLADHLISSRGDEAKNRIVVGFDARPTSRRFAEDAAGVLAAAGTPVLFFPEATPTPLVAYAAKHLSAAGAVVVTASHNPPTDNGYKVYGAEASLIVPPTDSEIQAAIAKTPPAVEIDRLIDAFTAGSAMVSPVPEGIFDCYWEEVSATRVRQKGSDLTVVYTPIHGVGRDPLFEMMHRAGHSGIVAVPEQSEPDGTFPTVAFPNPEEPGALDLALDLAREKHADLVIANDPDADRLAAVTPVGGSWRPLSGNEIGVLLGDYLLRNTPDPGAVIVASSIVSSPMLSSIASFYGARHEQTLTGFKWIVNAGLTLEKQGKGRFVFGYEEALGYTVGSAVRDKDGMSAALIFTDLVADLADSGRSIMDYLHELWAAHRMWVSAQASIVRPGPTGVESLSRAVGRLAEAPPSQIGGIEVTLMTDYRKNAHQRPPWLGEHPLLEFSLGDHGRVLVRPSGTEPKLKIYVDLCETCGEDPSAQHEALTGRAGRIGQTLGESLGL